MTFSVGSIDNSSNKLQTTALERQYLSHLTPSGLRDTNLVTIGRCATLVEFRLSLLPL